MNNQLSRDYAEAAEARAADLAETLENVICALGLNPVDFSDELTEPLITGVIAAMRQRVAELETDRDVWRVAHADNELYGLELIAQRDAALARVAELEAALDAERAAHRWRPVTEEPDSGRYWVRTRDGTITTDLFYFGDWLVLSGMVTHYMPMPDAPQEPTP